MPVDVLLGLQWGDEGKGKVVDVLGDRYQIVARFQGGPNAGHTIVINDRKFVLHQIPSGIFNPSADCIIGNGVVLSPTVLKQEIDQLIAAGIDPVKKLILSNKAHLILPTHRLLDQVYEASKGAKKIGSTLRGIGPTYQDKVARLGLRVGDILLPDFTSKLNELYDWHESIAKQNHPEIDFKSLREEFLAAVEFLKTLKIDQTEALLHKALKEGKNILAEGAQGTLLDVDFGSYPFVTSSSTVAAGACTGLGIPPSSIQKVYGVAKAYCTRVGSGPFPTELNDETGEYLRAQGREFGATTGRPRRCGWFDLPTMRYAVNLNGVTDLVLTKSDVMTGMKEIKVCTHYELNGARIDYPPYNFESGIEPAYQTLQGWPDIETPNGLHPNFKAYLDFLETELQTPITIVSTGVDRKNVILRN